MIIFVAKQPATLCWGLLFEVLLMGTMRNFVQALIENGIRNI